MVLDLEILAAGIATLTAVVTPFFVLLNKAGKLISRLSDLESWTRKQQIDIEHSQRERIVLITGTLACLKGLREKGCNGAVTKSIAEIEAFLVEEAHSGKSERGV